MTVITEDEPTLADTWTEEVLRDPGWVETDIELSVHKAKGRIPKHLLDDIDGLAKGKYIVGRGFNQLTVSAFERFSSDLYIFPVLVPRLAHSQDLSVRRLLP